VDNFAVENSKRAKRVEQRFEDLESESNTKLQEGVMSMQERLQELGGRVEENSRAFRHWQQMWESLAGFVEDLVAKIAEIQGFDPGRLPPGAPGGGAARPGNRGGPARPVPSPTPPRPPSGPPPDMNGGEGAVGNSARGPGESVDTMERWISSARNIVDGAFDNAMSQAQPRRAPAGRPQSAHAPRSRGGDDDDSHVRDLHPMEATTMSQALGEQTPLPVFVRTRLAEAVRKPHVRGKLDHIHTFASPSAL